MRFVTCRNGKMIDKKIVEIPSTSFADLLVQLGKAFDMTDVQVIFSETGVKYETVDVLRDNDVIVLSRGEPFINENKENPFENDMYISICVGGRKHYLLRSDIVREPQSILMKICVGEEISFPKDNNGVYCFNELQHFNKILFYISTGEIIDQNRVHLESLLLQAKYFHLENMILKLEEMLGKEEQRIDLTQFNRMVNSNNENPHTSNLVISQCVNVLKDLSSRIRKGFLENGPDIGRTLFPQSASEPDMFSIRRSSYIKWSNDENIQCTFRNTYKDAEIFFSIYYLTLVKDKDNKDSLPSNDILEEMMLRDGNLLETIKNNIVISIPVDKKIHDIPISTAINVSKRLLGVKRHVVSTIKDVGYQHVYLSNRVVDTTSEASSSSKSKDDPMPPPLKRKKTCQKAKAVDFEGMLNIHSENATYISPPTDGLHVDILICIADEKICRNLAKYLGLIFLEDVLIEANLPTSAEELQQIRPRNESAKIYTYLQNHLAKKLMFGQNNIVLTASDLYFKNIRANAKATILPNGKCEYWKLRSETNVEITSTKDAHILEYVNAITEIVDVTLNVRTDITTVFYSASQEKYYRVQFPLFSLIPLYILKLFSQKLHKDPNYLKYFSFKAV